MVSLTTAIKRNSKRALRGKWGRAIIVSAIFMLVCLFFRLLDHVLLLTFNIPIYSFDILTPGYFFDDSVNITPPAVFTVLMVTLVFYLIITPLKLGMDSWFYHLAGDERIDTLSVFSFFESSKMMFKAWIVKLMIGIKSLLWIILCQIPGVSMLVLSLWLKNNNSEPVFLNNMLVYICSFLIILGALFAAIINFRYFLATYLIAADRKLSCRQAIKKSVKITHGQKQQLFIFHFSFIGWGILCFAILPILFIMPYFMTGRAIFARLLIESFEEEKKPDTDSLSSTDGNLDDDMQDEKIVNPNEIVEQPTCEFNINTKDIEKS